MAHRDSPPMLPDERRPFPFEQRGWMYESMLHGHRVVAHVDADRVELLMTDCKDVAPSFPDIAMALRLVARGGRFVLDGVISKGRHARRNAADELKQRLVAGGWYQGAAAVEYGIFDVLVNVGDDITQQPLTSRKAALMAFMRHGMPRLFAHGGFEGYEGGALISARSNSSARVSWPRSCTASINGGVQSTDWVMVRPADARRTRIEPASRSN